MDEAIQSLKTMLEIGIQVIRAEQVVIATGSDAIEPPMLPFGGIVISSTEALELTQMPSRLVVVGGGYIGGRSACRGRRRPPQPSR